MTFMSKLECCYIAQYKEKTITTVIPTTAKHYKCTQCDRPWNSIYYCAPIIQPVHHVKSEEGEKKEKQEKEEQEKD